MSAITAKASRKMKKYAVLTREPRCFLGSFDFSWEQRKVQDVADRFDNLRIPVAANLRVHGTTPYYGANGIQDYVEGFTHDGEFVLVAEDGANDLKNYPVKCVNGRIWVNNHAHILQGKAGIADNSFLAFAISQSDIESLLVGGGRAKLNAETLMSIEFRLPCLQEQYRIGEYLTQLDHLITLHQRKCVFLFGFFQAFISMIFTASTFSWEQRKFEEIAVRSSVICSDANLPRVEYEDIVSGAGRLNKDIYAKQSSKSGIAFHQGDVLYGKLRPYLQNWLLPTFDGLAVGDFWVLQPQKADSSFLYRLIQSRQFDEVANQSTGTKMPRADWKLVSKTVFSIPSYISEQAAIGTYFTALDNLITLHQRKFEKLTNVKKSMLEKMFPQNGSSYPEIRFKGFTDPWEQRKLGELVDVCSGRDYKHLSEGTIPVYGTGGYMLSVNDALSYDRDAIGIGRKGTIDRPYILKAPFWTVDTLFYAIPREKADLNFAFDIFQNIDWKKKDESTGVPSLSKTAINDIDVLAPKHGEQQAIGQFFAAIDHLITLHQRELEKLQNIKKSMLEKMFV